MRLPDPKPKRPPIEKNEWDSDESPLLEYGTIEELKTELCRLLARSLRFVETDDPEAFGRLISPTWPWTKLGLDLLRCIRLADAIQRQSDTGNLNERTLS